MSILKKSYKKFIVHSWKDYWDTHSHTTDDPVKIASYTSEEVTSRIFNSIKKNLAIKSDDTILEIGCGNGLMLTQLSNVVNKCYGIDFSQGMLSCIAKTSNMDLAVAEALKVPFGDNVFDKVFCQSIFHYFPDLKYAENSIKEMARICKPGGRILIGDVPGPEEHQNMTKDFANRILFRFKFLKPLLCRIFNKNFNPYNLYYKRDFFYKVVKWLGYRCNINEIEIKGKTKFRYNVIISDLKK